MAVWPGCMDAKVSPVEPVVKPLSESSSSAAPPISARNASLNLRELRDWLDRGHSSCLALLLQFPDILSTPLDLERDL